MYFVPALSLLLGCGSSQPPVTSAAAGQGRLSVEAIIRKARRPGGDIDHVLLCQAQDNRPARERQRLNAELVRLVRRRKLNHTDWTHCRARHWVRRLIREAKAGKPRRTTVQTVDTVGWGCPVPPLVLTRSGSRGSSQYNEEILYPVTTRRLHKIVRQHLQGVFRLTGHFTGRYIDRYQWGALYGWAPPAKRGQGDYGRAWAQKYPEFKVTAWCYRPRRLRFAAAYRDNWRLTRKLLGQRLLRHSDYCRRRK